MSSQDVDETPLDYCTNSLLGDRYHCCAYGSGRYWIGPKYYSETMTKYVMLSSPGMEPSHLVYN
jgi:hypothetical protein